MPREHYAFEYPDQIADDDEFFYRNGGFWLKRTPETDPHVQELEALLEQGGPGTTARRCRIPRQSAQVIRFRNLLMR